MMTAAARVALHAIVLAGLNVSAIIIGFVVYAATGARHQLGVQLPVAIILSVLLFALWCAAIERWGRAALRMRHAWQCVWIYAAAMPCAWLVFIPLHYVTQGYLSSASNLVALACFQSIVNPIVLAIGLSIARRGESSTNGGRHASRQTT